MLLELLDYLKRLVDPSASVPLPVDVLLCCLSTLLRLTRLGHGSAVSIDLLSCARHLYAAMWLCMEASGAQHIPLLLDCVDELCLQNRQMPPARMSAFLHRLALLALSTQQPPFVLSALHCCHQLLLAYPACRALLDEPAVSGGRFVPEQDDCDASNAHTQPLLQLAALVWSSEPSIVQAVRAITFSPNSVVVLPGVAAEARAGSRRQTCGQVARQLQQSHAARAFALPPPAALLNRRAARQSNSAGKAKRVALHSILPTTDFLHDMQHNGSGGK